MLIQYYISSTHSISSTGSLHWFPNISHHLHVIVACPNVLMHMLIELTPELNGVKYIIKLVYIAKAYTMNYNNMNEDYLELVNVPLSVPSSLSIL